MADFIDGVYKNKNGKVLRVQHCINAFTKELSGYVYYMQKNGKDFGRLFTTTAEIVSAKLESGEWSLQGDDIR